MIDRYIDVRFRCECLKILLFGIHERWNTNEETYFGISYLSISCLEMLETSVLGLGQDLCLITALGVEITTLTYVSRIVFDLISSCFKVCDMFSAYVNCMVGIEHLFEDNF